MNCSNTSYNFKLTILYLVYFLSMFQERQCCLNWPLFKQQANSRGTLWDLGYNFNAIINHILIKIMTLSFRLGIEDDLCQSSWGPICMGNHDQHTQDRTPRSGFLLTTCCFQNTSQTLAPHTARIKRGPKATAYFMGTQKLSLTKLHFSSKDSLS